MNQFLHLVFLVAGALAALAIGLMCGLCFFVWLGGGRRNAASQAWRPADEP
jgi:hypothetical protein